MKYTAEEQERMLKVMRAFLSGEHIEVRARGLKNWVRTATPGWNWNSNEYRVAVEPKLRQWSGPEDIPMVCVFRPKVFLGNGRRMYLQYSDDIGVAIGGSSPDVTYRDLLENFEYSTDGHKWHPCGKVVAE